MLGGATAQSAGSAAVPASLRKCGNHIGRLDHRIKVEDPNVVADDCAAAERDEMSQLLALQAASCCCASRPTRRSFSLSSWL